MKEVVIVYHNHLDPEWARCYDRPLLRNGLVLRSYADVWEFIIDTWLELEPEGFQYTEGQYLVWRTYLRRHPEKAPLIKDLIRKGKLEILLQGELTPETNYLPAEGLARNYLLAKEFYDEFCGKDYAGTKKGFIWDAFGNSANMPQVLKLAGAEAVGGTKYRPVQEDFWVGIDGTALPCFDHHFATDIRGAERNVYYGLSRHVVCKDCKGYGCEKCGGRGMISKHPFRYDEAVEFLEAAAKSSQDIHFVMIGGEETLPNRCILDAMKTVNERHQGEVNFRFGDFSEYWETYKGYFESVRDQYTEPTEDLNPVHQGCYVTRIENKQLTRSITYDLLRAEAALANDMWDKGKAEKAPETFTLAWQNLLLNMHHDSLSGAHIDAGQRELLDFLDEAKSIAAPYIPGTMQVKANRLSGRELGDGVHVKQLGKMKISFDRSGILSIEKNGEDLFGSFHYEKLTFCGNSSDTIHIGELMLQCDWGDNHNAYFLGDVVTLGKYHYAVYEDENSIWWRGKHEAGDPGVKALAWEVRVCASPDGERLDFVTEVNWDTSNKRLRMAIPVNDMSSQTSCWEIPYGFIDRTYDPEKVPPFGVEHATLATRSIGEYPAIHWVAHAIDDKKGVAILNKGIPSAKWIPGVFEISLLRSPMMTGDTVIPSVDEIWDVDDTRDTGFHRFEFSIWPYTNGMTKTELTKTGFEYNQASPATPFDVQGSAVVTAFKPALDGNGLILRVQETEGDSSEMNIRFGRPVTVIPVDLMEEAMEPAQHCETFTYRLHKHQILTLRILMEGE